MGVEDRPGEQDAGDKVETPGVFGEQRLQVVLGVLLSAERPGLARPGWHGPSPPTR